MESLWTRRRNAAFQDIGIIRTSNIKHLRIKSTRYLSIRKKNISRSENILSAARTQKNIYQQNIYSPARTQKKTLLAEFNRASAGTPAWDLEKYLLFNQERKIISRSLVSTITTFNYLASPRHCTTAAQLATVARWQCKIYLWRNNFKQNTHHMAAWKLFWRYS